MDLHQFNTMNALNDCRHTQKPFQYLRHKKKQNLMYRIFRINKVIFRTDACNIII